MSKTKIENPQKLKDQLKAEKGLDAKALKKAKLDKTYKSKKDQLKKTTKTLASNLRQNTQVEMFAQGIENVKQLRDRISTAPIQMIVKLEDRYPGITLAAFTTHLKGAFKLNLKEWSSDAIYKQFPLNTKFKVSFLGNPAGENDFGGADMAKPSWRGMTKFEGGSPNLKRESIRRIGLKGQNKGNNGFHDNSGYMEIHTSDVIMFHDNNPAITTQFREKVGDKYKEIDAESYEKYANSKYAQDDQKFLDRHRSSAMFISKRSGMSRQKILEIREKIGNLQGLSAHQRIIKVVKFLIKPENHIYARHCGDWAKRVRTIAGIKTQTTLHHDISYAFKGGNFKKGGWKDETDPSRYDAKLSGKFASTKLLNKLKPGDEGYVNNRNKHDKAGNHRFVFIRWINRDKKIAEVASWYRNKPGGQKLSTYDFNKMPVTAILRPNGVTEYLPKPASEPKRYKRVEYDGSASERELIERGSSPFRVRRGYRMTPQEARWYRAVRRDAYRMAKFNINRRLDIQQSKFGMRDAYRQTAEMVRLNPKHYKKHTSVNDAIQFCESGYNTWCVNKRKSGNTYVMTGPAAGEYQILSLKRIWRSTIQKYTGNTKRARYYRRQLARSGFDVDKLMKVDFSAPRPELATPAQRCAFVNLTLYAYTRRMKGLESLENIYERADATSGRMRRSWLQSIYFLHRNGPPGTVAIVKNLRKGIPLPTSYAQAVYYHQNYLPKNSWQYKRGLKDFWLVTQVSMKFRRRYEKNMRELAMG